MSYVYVGDVNGQPRSDLIKRLPDGAFIPNNMDNRDWVTYQDWLNDGNTPDPVGSDFTLNDRKTVCLNKLLLYRDNIIYSGFTYNGRTYNTDQNSQILMNAALAQSERGFDIFPADWILQDGSVYQISYEEMKALSGALSAFVAACYANYVVLKTQINESSDPESIDITQGWPA